MHSVRSRKPSAVTRRCSRLPVTRAHPDRPAPDQPCPTLADGLGRTARLAGTIEVGKCALGAFHRVRTSVISVAGAAGTPWPSVPTRAVVNCRPRGVVGLAVGGDHALVERAGRLGPARRKPPADPVSPGTANDESHRMRLTRECPEAGVRQLRAEPGSLVR